MNRTSNETHPLRAQDSFQPLMSHVIAATGLVYYADRGQEFASHIARRLQASSSPNCQSYLRLLQSGQAGQQELDELIALLTIGETHFFRHRELFDALEHTLLPDLIDKNRSRRLLRIWSAGCSTGAEAYSVSILLRHRFADQVRGWDIQILGTDINREYLARAAVGHYDTWALRSVSAEERALCFTCHEKRWSLNPNYRTGVAFDYHNLATAPFPVPNGGLGGFDLILCRNVMIYFALEAVRNSIEKFYASLCPGGWLLVGHAEHNTAWFRRFRTVMSHGAVLYQKRDTDAATPCASESLEAKPLRFPAPPDPTSPAAGATEQAHAIAVAESSNQTTSVTSQSVDGNTQLQEICLLADQGDIHSALRCCQASLTVCNTNPLLHFYHGLLLHQLGEHADAERSLRRATFLDRNCLLAHYYLGLLWQQQGRVSRAIGSFRNVARLLLKLPSHAPIPNADGLTVENLTRLTAAHLAALEAP